VSGDVSRAIVQRLISMAFVVVGLTLIVFVVANIIPADPAKLAAGLSAREEQVEQVRRTLGLDRPLPEQYLSYMSRLLRGDLGVSFLTQRPVVDDIKVYFPATLELTLVATLIFLGLGIPLGVVSAIVPGRWPDLVARITAVLGMGLPAFWLGLMAQVVFFRWLDWLPAVGRIDPNIAPPLTITGLYLVDSVITWNWSAFSSSLRHLALPASVLAMARFGVTIRFVRAGMLEVLRSDYVRTARAKGLRERSVLFGHALRNALIPVVTMTGLQFGWLLGGTVLVETVFSWPGMGTYAIDSIQSLDFPATAAVTLVLAVAFVLVNLLVDLLYGVLDPRISGV
jgi:peptide/nickel transport system permease protein